MNDDEKQKTMTVMVHREEDQSLYDEVKVPVTDDMTVGDIIVAAWKIKRGSSPPPELVGRSMFCMEMENAAAALETIKASGMTTGTIIEMDYSDGDSRLVNRIEVDITSFPQDPRKKKIKLKE
jgi:hypothetical protein